MITRLAVGGNLLLLLLAVEGLDHAFAAGIFPATSQPSKALRSGMEQFPPSVALTRRHQHQAMLFSVIVIALISLLVATDPEQ